MQKKNKEYTSCYVAGPKIDDIYSEVKKHQARNDYLLYYLCIFTRCLMEFLINDDQISFKIFYL